MRTHVTDPDWKRADIVLPEAKDSIQSITKSKSFLFAVYSDGVVGRLVKYAFDTGKAEEVKLPASGTVGIDCPDFRTNQCIVSTTSWIQPRTLYDFDAENDTFAKSIFNTAVSYPGFDNLVTEEVEVPGHDGTMIPLSIIHRKDLKLDGSSSAILEGYGAYGISYTPGFNVRHSIALHGIVLAYAHVRGGSEKGEAWYKAGYKATKPNTWKDFISSAEYLDQEGLYERRPTGWDRHERRRNPYQPRADRAAGPFRRRRLQRGRGQRDACRIQSQRTGQHARIWNRRGCNGGSGPL